MELTAFAGWLNSAFGGYDRFLLRLMHSMADSLGSVLTPLMKGITFLGEKGLILIVISLVLMLFSRTRRTGVCMFGAIACGAILTNFILKDWVARPRPFESFTAYRQWWEALGAPAEDGFSFPSGHVTAAVAGLTGLCLTRGRKWILPSVIWVLLMAVSRNYLMAHFPSDVLFAALIGLIAAFIAYAITQLIFRLLEQHDDKRLCALLLDFDLPLRLPSLRRRSEEDELDDEEYDEEPGDDEEYDDEPEKESEVKVRKDAWEYTDPEKLDISATFDQIVSERRRGSSAGADGEDPDEETERSFFHPRRSANNYQGKHMK
ncbi:MAG: phosphatase PAP2 family protein [Oscillospiraceae bacterium]|nr:phosphatase PAP2 family protein [Oscillospiraceae bacterium]